MSKSKIVIYTVNTHNLMWIFEVITSAFWVIKKRKNTTEVEIVILDDASISYTKNLIKHYIKIIYSNLNKYVKNILRKYFFKLIFSKNFFNKLIKFLETPFNKNSIYNQLLLNKQVVFKYENIEFIIKKSKFINNHFAILIKLKAYLISFFIFFYYKLLKTPKKFLNLTFNNNLIGDIIASTFLRKKPANAGRFKLSITVLNLLIKVIYYELHSKYNEDYFSKHTSYIILPEPTYLQVIWKRILVKYGVVAIETHSYKGKFFLSDKHNSNNPWIAMKKKITVITEIQKKNIDDFFYTRLNNPQKIMAYLTDANSNNNNEKQIFDLENNSIVFKNTKLDKNKELVAVIFLHSFDDAQYCFGIDDFTDLYEWTVYSIESCLANKEFDKILIKPHPGLDYDIFPGDKIAFDRLYKKFNNLDKLNFIKRDSSIVYLSQVANVVGLTHHGSVAEELVYLNQNAIGYVGGMWSDHYKFLHTWDTKDQYKIIINNFNKNNLIKPSNYEKECLYNYIIERKLNAVDLRKYSIRLLLAKKINVFKHWGDFNDYADSWLRFENEMQLICNDNLFTSKILKVFHDQAELIE